MSLQYLKIVYPELPPTSNRIYFRGTILRKEARTYAENFAKYVAQKHLHEISQMNPEGVFSLILHFYFDSLINETWNNPKVPESKRAKSRYKKIDLTNRIKLLEDCVRDALDIDDSQTFCSFQRKIHAPNNSHVEIEVEELSPSMFGLTEI